MRLIGFVLPVLVALGTLAPAAAHADPYRWCAQYGGSAGGASNCGFVTFQQCLETLSGMGGFCVRNQFYTGPDRTTGYGPYERRYRYER